MMRLDPFACISHAQGIGLKCCLRFKTGKKYCSMFTLNDLLTLLSYRDLTRVIRELLRFQVDI
ncbi:MAG: hypothetical protein ACI9CO_001300 [Candidatus Azotimanducaceae bacterium]|jgi:hypothetical protein